MRYWWVNQNQTYRHEMRGGYLWSPKRNRNNGRNPFYDFMREVSPGDVVFSFVDTFVKSIGIALSHAYEAPKPLEFGTAGAYWDRIGWRVDVTFTELQHPIRPSDCMHVLAPLMPARYAPLQVNGRGLQGVYLTRLPETLAIAIVDLIGAQARNVVKSIQLADKPLIQAAIGLVEWEEHEMEVLRQNARMMETDRAAIVLARRGQGLFKERVMRLERKCRITGITRPEHLRASHCKPWRDATNDERLDGENGLLLTPNADHLFDRGFIGFENNGDLLISPVADKESLARMGINPRPSINVGRFADGQKHYLEYHRENVLLRSRFLEGE